MFNGLPGQVGFVLFVLFNFSQILAATPCQEALAQMELAKDGVFDNPSHVLDWMDIRSEDKGFHEKLLSFTVGRENGATKIYFWESGSTGDRGHDVVNRLLKTAYPNFEIQYIGTTFLSAAKRDHDWSSRVVGIMLSTSQETLFPGRPYRAEDIREIVSYLSQQYGVQLETKRPITLQWPESPSSVSIPELLHPVGVP